MAKYRLNVIEAAALDKFEPQFSKVILPGSYRVEMLAQLVWISDYTLNPGPDLRAVEGEPTHKIICYHALDISAGLFYGFRTAKLSWFIDNYTTLTLNEQGQFEDYVCMPNFRGREPLQKGHCVGFYWERRIG